MVVSEIIAIITFIGIALKAIVTIIISITKIVAEIKKFSKKRK
jgi:hypothetical protein